VLYSDGVTEATNNGGKEFGEDGLANFLAGKRARSCQEIVDQLVEHLRRWRENVSFADDFTIVLLRRL
jgi:serine phosphatase RsbU (regulator of sigma subunit)